MRGCQLGELEVAAICGTVETETFDWHEGLAHRGSDAKVVSKGAQARVKWLSVLVGLTRRHTNNFLQLLHREFRRLGLIVGKSAYSSRNVLHLGGEFCVERLNRMLHRLVQLLETLVDLIAVVCSHILIHRDELV